MNEATRIGDSTTVPTTTMSENPTTTTTTTVHVDGGPVQIPSTDHGPNDIFDHTFSGYSIWLEPESNDFLVQTMEYLQTSCGGPSCGVHPFVPHITLLYNIPSESFSKGKLLSRQRRPSQDDVTDNNNECDDNFVDIMPTLLQQQLEDVWRNVSSICETSPPMGCLKTPTDDPIYSTTSLKDMVDEQDKPTLNDDEGSSVTNRNYTIQPSDWYYLHYPKSADNGKGFGAAIALLLVENESWLQTLYDNCIDAFGQGERNDFIPHLSLVYAPESRGRFLSDYVQNQRRHDEEQTTNRTEGKSIDRKSESRRRRWKIRSLSIWNTQGRIDDWYRIAEVPVSALNNDGNIDGIEGKSISI